MSSGFRGAILLTPGILSAGSMCLPVVMKTQLLVWCPGQWGWTSDKLQGPATATAHDGGQAYCSAGCEAQLRCRCGGCPQCGMPTGINRLEREFYYFASQCWHYTTWGHKKWLPPVSQSKGSIPTGSFLSGRCFEISKWIPFTYDLCTFPPDGFFAGFQVEWVCKYVI